MYFFLKEIKNEFYHMSIFNFTKRLKNFSYAVNGVFYFIKREPNAKFYLAMTIILPVIGFYTHLRRVEWISLILAGSIVWMAEALNTAIELLADEVSLQQRERIGHAKDVAAGAVLLAAIGAAIVGVIVFLPHLLHFFKEM